MSTFLSRSLTTTQKRFYSAAATQQRQINLLLFGAPGVGKGTYSKFIEKDFNFANFSMGDYFRKLINSDDKNDKFVEELKHILRSGQLVDDDHVIGVIKKIQKDDEYSKYKGLILDGVPRTVN